MKKWSIARQEQEAVNRLARETGLTPLCAAVLISRGIDSLEKAEGFFRETPLSDPFLMQDMEEAVSAISEAAEAGEPICVYGDYDCDGVTATVMLYSYLECLGAEVSYYIPERDEGYGLNENAVRALAQQGVKLIVTVDNGVSAAKEAELIYDLGMRLVITDHHQPPEILPRAEAIVDPHREGCISPFKQLCGAGVVLKLLAALEGGEYDMILEQFSDLAALATVADVVPLVGENRVIVEYGLHQLGNTENLGLTALMEECKLDPQTVTSTTAAFMIAPRINAAGRFGSPMLAARLLLCEAEEEAVELASELSSLNNARKQEEQRIMGEIRREIEKRPELLMERILFFAGAGWHHGVIGIVSARLTEKYSKPCFVVSIEGDEARGSARGVPGFSIYEALSDSASLLERFGGHPGAGGFSLSAENVEKMYERLKAYSKEKYPSMPMKTVSVDAVLFPEWLTLPGVQGLSSLEPVGEGNPKPLFAMLGATIEELIPLSGGKHTKLKLRYGGLLVFALMFGVPAEQAFFQPGDRGDFLVSLEISRFQGRESISVRVQDCRKSGVVQAKYLAAREVYEHYRIGEEIPERLLCRVVPEREDLVRVYQKLSDKAKPVDALAAEFPPDVMNYCKLRLCLDILGELGLIFYDDWEETAGKLPVKGKADLESSRILQRLRCLKCQKQPCIQ